MAKLNHNSLPQYLDHDAAGHGEVAVEPGVPDAAAIALHAHLQATLLGPLGPGLHPQAGAVCVRSHHGEAIAWQVASAHRKGNDAGEVPGQEVLREEGRREGGEFDSKKLQLSKGDGDEDRPWWMAGCPTAPPPSAQ